MTNDDKKIIDYIEATGSLPKTDGYGDDRGWHCGPRQDIAECRQPRFKTFRECMRDIMARYPIGRYGSPLTRQQMIDILTAPDSGDEWMLVRKPPKR